MTENAPDTSDNTFANKKKNPSSLVRRSSRGRTPAGEPNPIDVHVGDRIRRRRTLLGLSQEQFASLLGITFQQVQKYERGMNRIGASRLWDVAKVLDTEISYFYEEMDENTMLCSPRHYSLNPNSIYVPESGITEVDPMKKNLNCELVRMLEKIPNRKIARYFYALIAATSATTLESDPAEKILKLFDEAEKYREELRLKQLRQVEKEKTEKEEE